jgi:hypothetical protein
MIVIYGIVGPAADRNIRATQGWRGPAARPRLASVSRAAAKKREKRAYDVRTNREPHSERLHVRLTPTEVVALDYLAERWDASRSASFAA